MCLCEIKITGDKQFHSRYASTLEEFDWLRLNSSENALLSTQRYWGGVGGCVFVDRGGK